MGYSLREDTASQEIVLGRFVDSTDGNTEETGLTIANTDIKIWKHGATTLASKNSGGATHIANGVYYCVLDATDTDTPGNLRVTVHVAGALPVHVDCFVYPTAVYDLTIGATTLGTQQTGDAFARLGAPAGASISADVAAVKTDTAAILVDTGTTLDGKLDTIDSNVDAILVDTGTDGVVIVDGGLTAAKIGSDAFTAAKFAADVTTELQSGLATAAALTTVDTVVDAIKAKTDSLTFTQAGAVDANVTHVNETAVTGDGASGTEWGPA